MPKFIDRFLASQLRQPHGWFGSLILARGMNRVNAKIVETTLERLELSPDHHVLEIGFGGGLALQKLTRQLTSRVVEGVDLSPEMVRAAEQKFRSEIAQGRMRVQLGDVMRLPFPDRTFDRVFTINTIYFWPDTAKGMSEIYRVLKPGGKAAIGIRSADKMRQHSVTQYNFRLFSGEEVAQGMRATGFVDVQLDHRDQDRWYDQVIITGTK